MLKSTSMDNIAILSISWHPNGKGMPALIGRDAVNEHPGRGPILEAFQEPSVNKLPNTACITAQRFGSSLGRYGVSDVIGWHRYVALSRTHLLRFVGRTRI